jgi:hypothetical protein
MRIPHWLAAPDNTTATQRKNFLLVQADAIPIGVYAATGLFLPVFLTRLGATSFQVGLLTALPALTGFLLSVALGRALQSRRNMVPWYAASRLLVTSTYTALGLMPFFVPPESVLRVALYLWAISTIPQTVQAITFSVVMNAVAGPRGRLVLMSRRWSLLSLTTAVATAIAGRVLDRLPFPSNYQLVFVTLSLGGWFSYYLSSRILLPDSESLAGEPGRSLRESLSGLVQLVRGENAFMSFAVRRFIFQAGVTLAIPLFPLYYVRVVRASDAWIGGINTAQTIAVLAGYFLWARQARLRGSRFVLLSTTLCLGLYPALVAATRRAPWIVAIAALAGFFQAGLDLVFFDELMQRVPLAHSATFVALAQSLQHLASFAAPLAGTALADRWGLGSGLMLSAVLCFAGFTLFARSGQVREVGKD